MLKNAEKAPVTIIPLISIAITKCTLSFKKNVKNIPKTIPQINSGFNGILRELSVP